MHRCLGVAMALLALAGCKEEGNGNMAGAAGTLGLTAGMGSTAGTGVAGTGAAGTGAAGTGAAGTGIAGTGTAGMAAAGMGAAGMSGDGMIPGCSAADSSVTGSAAHMAVANLLSAQSPCGFSSCHTGASPRAMLSFMGQTDFRTLLVGKPSCQSPGIPLVADGGGDAALNNSWLWIKLTAPAGPDGTLQSNAAWGTAVSCGQTPSQPFGARMPLSNTDDVLEDTRLAAIRNWICAGAPGP